jgi:hypothetical protein
MVRGSQSTSASPQSSDSCAHTRNPPRYGWGGEEGGRGVMLKDRFSAKDYPHGEVIGGRG